MPNGTPSGFPETASTWPAYEPDLRPYILLVDALGQGSPQADEALDRIAKYWMARAGFTWPEQEELNELMSRRKRIMGLGGLCTEAMNERIQTLEMLLDETKKSMRGIIVQMIRERGISLNPKEYGDIYPKTGYELARFTAMELRKRALRG